MFFLVICEIFFQKLLNSYIKKVTMKSHTVLVDNI